MSSIAAVVKVPRSLFSTSVGKSYPRVCASESRELFFIVNKVRAILELKTLQMVYCSAEQPLLLNGILDWGRTVQCYMDPLEKVQKLIIKVIDKIVYYYKIIITVNRFRKFPYLLIQPSQFLLISLVRSFSHL